MERPPSGGELGSEQNGPGTAGTRHWYEIRSAVIFKRSSLLAISGKRKAILDKQVVAGPAETSPVDFGGLLRPA